MNKVSNNLPLLHSITKPSQVALLSLDELQQLATEIRMVMISSVSRTGGHLASSLGVVELTLALLSVFNPALDKIIWDVGHQSYAYKLLTGRADRFDTLRQYGGISGFPSRDESIYDHFGTGHSSTSISAALGMASARDMAGEKYNIVSIIGDGSLTAGMAYEALNHAGAKDRPFIVILNDNAMSISKNVGALSLFMSKQLSSPWIRRFEKEIEVFLKSIPAIGDDLVEIARRSKHSFKNFFSPGIFFEALRFNYIGAVDGHNIAELQKVMNLALTLDKPVLIHVLTQKGKGYIHAENNPVRFHGISRFEPKTGVSCPSGLNPITYTEVFGDTLISFASKDEKIVAITAAMPEGTGLIPFSKKFPDRFFDVGICEQHAVTFAAGLATQGLRPFVAIYSTFMQRGYDQIIHDVCVQKLPVVFCLDRAGIVGEDGATHQGVFDIAYLRHIPEMVFFAPKDEAELQRGIATALAHNGPFALRYPRGVGSGVPLFTEILPLNIGEGEYLIKNEGGVAVIAIGSMVQPSFYAAQELTEEGYPVTVLNARWVKPLPKKFLKEIAYSYDKIIIVEEHSLCGGFSSSVLEYLVDENLLSGQVIRRIGIPDRFIEHGNVNIIRNSLGLDKESIKKEIFQQLQKIV